MKHVLYLTLSASMVLVLGQNSCGQNTALTDVLADVSDTAEADVAPDLLQDLQVDLNLDAQVPDELDTVVPVAVSNNVVIVNALSVGGGFSFAADSQIENALAGMVAEKALVDGVAKAMIETGEAILLLEFQGLTQLPPVGDSVTLDVIGILGGDLNGNWADNFILDSFYPALINYDSNGNPYIRFHNVIVSTDIMGNSGFAFDLDPYLFTFYRAYTGMEYDVEIRHLKFSGLLSVDSDGHLVVASATVGGVVADAMLLQFGQMVVDVTGLAADVAAFRNAEDIDLGNTGAPNALSLGFVLSAVPAFLMDVAPLAVANEVMIVDQISISGGFDMDGDQTVDNALDGTSEAALLEATLQALLETGGANLLLQVNLDQLPPPGGCSTADIVGIVGVDLDGNPSNNFEQQSFAMDPTSVDALGNPYVVFRNIQIDTGTDGITRFHYSIDPYNFNFRRAASGLEYAVEIRRLEFKGTLALDGDSNIVMHDAVLGGVLSDVMLLQFGQMLIDMTGMAVNVSGFQEAEDIDLGGTSSPDGLSVGFRLTGVPALLQ